MNAPDVHLENNIWVVIGPPDSGKSNFVKYLLSLDPYRRHLVYDPLFGYDPSEYYVVRPPDESTKYRRYEAGNPELNRAVDKFVLVDKEKRPSYFIIDEAGRLLPNQKDEGSAMGELNDFNAHYGISVGLIGQRLQQINSDFENKATHYFILGAMGKNDFAALNDLHEDAEAFVKASRPFGATYIGTYGGETSICNIAPPPKMGEKGQL